jgi:hypothetical protein
VELITISCVVCIKGNCAALTSKVVSYSSRMFGCNPAIYPEARHGFDVSDLPPYAKFGSEIVAYNAAADVAAAREVQQFMSRKTD